MNTLDKAETAFAVEDTARVNLVEIKDNEGRTIILERVNEGYWNVSNTAFKFRARPDAVKTLLSTVKRMRVAHPVNKSALPHVQKQLENPVRTVKVYTDKLSETPAKTYRIAGNAPENKGTIIQLDNGKQPYVVNIPGMQGHLLPRFVTIYETWRDRNLFRYNPQNIASVKVTYPANPQASFLLDAANPEAITLTSLSDRNSGGKPLVKQVVNDYLANFRLVNLEAFQNDYPRIDSVRQSTPYCNITVTDRKGNVKRAVVHHMPVNKRSKLQTDRHGNPILYDVDRLFAFVNNGDFAIIQRYHCGWMFKSYDDFYKLPEVEK